MAANGAMCFKVFLRDDGNTDVRRFNLDDASVATNFEFMKEKLQMVFPVLRNNVFKVTWRDAEMDEITITCDEDLITAYTEMVGNVKALYVTILEKKEDDDILDDEPMMGMGDNFLNIVCDGCNAKITGYRYKCLQCPDYDLCAACEQKGLHSEHLMVRSSQPQLMYPRCGRRFMAHVMRGFKKAQNAAAKETHRAQRHAHKAYKHFEKEVRTEAKSSAQAGASNSAFGPETACPMSNIGSFVAPMLDAFLRPQPPTQAPNTNEPTAQKQNIPFPPIPIADIVNKAVTSFFEGMATATNMGPQTQPSTPQAQQNPQTNVPQPNAGQATGATPKNTGSTQNSTPQSTSGQNTPTSFASAPSAPRIYPEVPLNIPINVPIFSKQQTSNTPMEVEGNSNGEVIVIEDENVRKVSEPGWTVIGQAPPPNTPTNEKAEAAAEVAAAASSIPKDPKSLKIAEGLKQLIDMGFSNELNLVALLKRYDGNVGMVVKHLFENNP